MLLQRSTSVWGYFSRPQTMLTKGWSCYLSNISKTHWATYQKHPEQHIKNTLSNIPKTHRKISKTHWATYQKHTEQHIKNTLSNISKTPLQNWWNFAEWSQPFHWACIALPALCKGNIQGQKLCWCISCRLNSFMTYLLPSEFFPLTWPARSVTTVADVAIATLFNFILPALGER